MVLQLRAGHRRGGRPGGTDRRDHRARRPAVASSWQRAGRLGPADRRGGGVHRTGDQSSSPTGPDAPAAGSPDERECGTGDSRRTDPRTPAAEFTADGHVHPQGRTGGAGIPGARCARRSRPTCPVIRSPATYCSPTYSPRSTSGCRERRWCWHRSRRRGASGRSGARGWPAIRRFSPAATTGSKWPPRSPRLSVAGPGGQRNRRESDDFVRLSSALSIADTGEVDDARRRLRSTGRGNPARGTRTHRRSHRRRRLRCRGPGGPGPLGAQARHRPAAHRLACSPRSIRSRCPARRSQTSSAKQLLDDVRDTLKAVPHYGIGYGLLRYTVRPDGAAHWADTRGPPTSCSPMSEPFPMRRPINLRMRRFGSTPTRRCRFATPCPASATPWSFGCTGPPGCLHLDWWYDSRRLGPTDAESFAQQYSSALLEIVRGRAGRGGFRFGRRRSGVGRFVVIIECPRPGRSGRDDELRD